MNKTQHDISRNIRQNEAFASLVNKRNLTADMKIRDQYGKVSIVISVWDNIVITTAGMYHISKVWAVK